jgi:hypothetical protein
MGYVKASTTTRYTLPSDSNYYVELKDRIFYGDLKAASRSAIKIGPGGKPEVDNEAMTDNLMLAYIAGWSIDDDAGNVLPLTPASLNSLVDEDANFLSEIIGNKRATQETEQKNS